jgi:hypothetical protein
VSGERGARVGQGKWKGQGMEFLSSLPPSSKAKKESPPESEDLTPHLREGSLINTLAYPATTGLPVPRACLC